MKTIDEAAVRAAILELCAARGAAKSICPSDAARRLAADAEEWRLLMPQVRRVGRALAAEGRIMISQRGAPIDPSAPVVGPIRFRLAV